MDECQVIANSTISLNPLNHTCQCYVRRYLDTGHRIWILHMAETIALEYSARLPLIVQAISALNARSCLIDGEATRCRWPWRS
jgi:hypothetical protein